MPDHGIVSIITPSYNSSRFIAETIESVISQTYTNWELLITDDCSTDDTVRIVMQYAGRDSRIKLFRMERNSGAGVCRNRSIREAKGRFIAFCDSDDCWLPCKLERQVSFMLRHGCALSYSSYLLCDEQSEVAGIVVARKRETLASTLRDSGIGCLTAIYDTSKVGKVYMPELRKRQDWGLWLKILLKCGVAYGMKEPLAIYRVRGGSISRNKFSLVRYNLNVYREVMGFPALKAGFYFFFLFLPNYFLKKTVQRYVNR